MRPSVVILFFAVCFGLFLADAHGQQYDDLIHYPVELGAPAVEQAGKQAQFTYESKAITAEFTGVIIQGFTSDASLEGFIRFYSEDGWSDWHDLYIVTSYTDAAFMAAYRSEAVRQGQSFELRFDQEAGSILNLHGGGVFDSRLDEVGSSEKPPTGEAAKSADHILPPVIVRRTDWGAQSFIGDPIPLARPNYTNITFHHAAGFWATTLEEGKEQVRRIQDFHQNGRGWSDIGYQFVLDRSGNLYQGRPFMDESVDLKDTPTLANGAHVGGHNTGNIGVCVLGCYHPPEGSYCEDIYPTAALDSLVTMFAFLSDRYGVAPEAIKGHRDFSSTSCPGDNNYVNLPSIRERVQEVLETGNQRLGRASLASRTDDAGVVHLSWEFLENQGIDAYRLERVIDRKATVVYTAEGAQPDAFSDTELTEPGTVEYLLFAENNAGREQLLASSLAVVDIPDTYTLAHTFPNPFHDRTTIRYYLRLDGIVRLAVYDATGRRITQLVDAYQKAGQWYTAPFDATGLASGVYYYRIEVEGFSKIDYSKTRPLVLVR